MAQSDNRILAWSERGALGFHHVCPAAARGSAGSGRRSTYRTELRLRSEENICVPASNIESITCSAPKREARHRTSTSYFLLYKMKQPDILKKICLKMSDTDFFIKFHKIIANFASMTK